ncbi:TBC1 domain family member 13 [Halotydeus destructor]|nr:TBC1 domain family member 13 [Halotydeus destructor]
MVTIYKERLNRFSELLEKSDIIDFNSLRQIVFDGGCPDDCNYRSLSWKLLLGYLNPDKQDWRLSLEKKRQIYKSFVSELILNDQSNNSHDDHPLNPAPSSQWNTYFKDNEVLSQILKDVRRLYPDISFFQQKVLKSFSSDSLTCDIIGRTSTSKPQSIDIIRNTFGGTQIKDNNKNGAGDDDVFHDLIDVDDKEEYHWQIVARILFIYAKLNPGQGYVQGMNEIIGPIYYVFTNDMKDDWNKHSEADTFWCFTELMSEIRDMYNSQLDADRSTGVVSMMTRLTNLLSQEDKELYFHLYNVQAIKPHYYAFRWITLLLSQEFPLPEVLRIWDFLFADQNRFAFLISTCCAMLILLREDLLQGDFASNMKLLQNFPERFDVTTVIRAAKNLIR